jgi:DNA-binding GntR family transcriptional regulator
VTAGPASRTRVRPLLADVVRAELRGAIVAGEFPLGTKLPNEEQLCVRFGVSRVTIREAVRGLIEDGYVVRRQGSGTYVTRRPVLQATLDKNFSYTEYLESSGTKAGRHLISARTVTADAETREALALPEGAKVMEIRRTRTADGRPAIYSVDSIPNDIVEAGTDRASLRGSLYRVLTDHEHPVAHGEAILAPALADRDLARILDVAAGTPVQYLKQIDYDGSGRPVMLSLEWHVPAVIELRVYRRGPGALLGPDETAT